MTDPWDDFAGPATAADTEQPDAPWNDFSGSADEEPWKDFSMEQNVPRGTADVPQAENSLPRLRSESFKMLNQQGRVSPSVQRNVADRSSGLIGDTMKGGKNLMGRASESVGRAIETVGAAVAGRDYNWQDKSLNEVFDYNDLKEARDKIAPGQFADQLEPGVFDKPVNRLVQYFEGNGITDGKEMMTILKDSIAENNWDATSDDKARVLSDGTLRVNPKFVALPDAQEGIKAIQSAPVDDATRERETQRFLTARKVAAKALDEKTKSYDADYRKYAAEQAAKGVTDPEQVFFSWPGLNRNWIENSWDVVRDTVSQSGRDIYNTIVRAPALGVANALGDTEDVARIGKDIIESGQKGQFNREIAAARGQEGAITGTGKELGTTVLDMAPMFAGAGAGRLIAGGAEASAARQILGNITAGTSVYGYAGAQGYASLMQTALETADRKAEQEGRELTPQEIDDTVSRSQGAALANGFQTAILSKLLGEGVEHAAFKGLSAEAGAMTGRDVLAAFRQKYGADGVRAAITAIKPELKEFAKQAYEAGKVGFKDEALEEGLNQYLEGVITKAGADPDKTWDEIGQETFKGAWMGGVVGGGLPVATQTLAKSDPVVAEARQLAVAAQDHAPAAAATAAATTRDLEGDEETTPPAAVVPTSAPAAATAAAATVDDLSPLTTDELRPETTADRAEAGTAPEPGVAPVVEQGGVDPGAGEAEPGTDAATGEPAALTPEEEDAEFVRSRKEAKTKARREDRAADPLGQRLNAIEETWETNGVEVVSTDTADGVELTILRVPENQRGQGIGSKVLDDFKTLANETGKPVILLAEDIDHQGQVPSIFYKKNGFTELGGNRFRYDPKTPVTDATLPSVGPAAAAGTPAAEVGNAPVVGTTPEGETREAVEGVPVPGDVGTTDATPDSAPPENVGAPSENPVSEAASAPALQDEVATQTPEQLETQVRDIEATAFEGQPQGVPPVEPPGYDGTPDGDHVSIMHAFIDDARARRGLPPLMSKPQLTDADAWDAALAAEQAHRAAGKPGRAGWDLFNSLITRPPLALDKLEKALLLHELLIAEGSADAAYHNLNNLGADASDATRKDYQAQAAKAQENYDLLTQYLRSVGTASGISLQAQKMIVNRDFTLARVVNELKAAKNQKSDKPVEWTAADQKKAEEWFNKWQAAKQRVDELEAANDEQSQLIVQLTADVEQAQKKAEAQARQPALRKKLKEKLGPAADAARARIEERRRKGGPDDPEVSVMYSGPPPELLEDLRDYAIILADKLVDGAFDLSKATQSLIGDMGQKFAEFGEWVFGEAQRVFRETAASVTGEAAPTPQDVIDSIDSDEPLDRADVWSLARAHVLAGARGNAVLDNVTRDLAELYPDLTREKVAELFTDYGKVTYPSKNETTQELQRVKTLERIGLKLKDVREGKMPKRTGFQRGEQDAEIRELEKQFREEYRQLEDRMRAQGVPFEDNERRLKSALGAVKRRMRNEIEEIERALKSMTPRTDAVRTPVPMDEDAVALRSKLEGLRQQYAETFDKGTTEEKKIAAVEKYLDRAIAEEEQMLKDGILAKIKGTPVSSAAIEAKRDQLAQMRKHRRDLYAAAHPETALDQAKQRVRDSIERLADMIARNDVRVKKKASITPDEELGALIDAREALADQVKEMRRALPATPEQQAAKEKRLLEAAERTLASIEKKLATNDLAVKAPVPAAVPWAVEQVRTQIKELNRQLDARRREAKVGPYSDAAREARALGSIRKRGEELRRRLRESDFSKKAAPVPVNTKASRDASFELAKLQGEYAEARQAYLYKNASRSDRFIHNVKTVAAAQKLLTLGGDVGVILRNLGGATVQAVANDALKLAPGEAGRRARAADSQLLRMVQAGVKAFADPAKEQARFEELMKRPNAGWDKTAGMVYSAPFETDSRNKEDLPAANLIEKWPWYIWPILATGKVALIASNPVVAAAVGLTATKAAALIGISSAQKPLLMAIDRAQRAMTNEVRAMMFDQLVDNHPGGLTTDDAKALAKSVMTATGRGSLKKLEGMMPGANVILLAPRYYLSRILTLVGQPLYSGPMSGATRVQIAANYAKGATVRGALIALLAMAFGKADDDDPQDTGVVLNPRSKDFLRVRITPTLKLDVMSGLNQFFHAGFRQITGTVQDQKTGQTHVMTPREKSDDLRNFAAGKMNMLVRYGLDTMHGEYFGGKPVVFSTLVDEATSMIIIDDLQKIYAETDPATATAVSALLLGGANVTAGDFSGDKAKWAELRAEMEQLRKEREERLNE